MRYGRATDRALPPTRGFPHLAAGRRQVDGGRKGGGIADRVLSAGRAHAAPTRALARRGASVVHKVCCHGETVKSLAEQTGEARDVVVKLLKVGLDLLAMHYGMRLRRRVG